MDPGRRRRRVQPLDAAGRAVRCLVPERCRDPSVDGRLGSAADPRRTPAVRRVVPVPLARRVAFPPLPEPAPHLDGHRNRRARRRHVPVVVVPVVVHLADRRVLRRKALRPRAVGGWRGRPGVAPDRERPRTWVRMVQLRLARLGHVGPAMGDVGAAVRMGTHLACGLEGQDDRARGVRPGHHDLPAPVDRLPGDAEPGRVGAISRRATSGAAPAGRRSSPSAPSRPLPGCWSRSSPTRSG